MALEIKLSQKLSQSLVMTPQLQQAIKLLQLGRMDYLEVIEKELLENPVLEAVGGESEFTARQDQSSEPFHDHDTGLPDFSHNGGELPDVGEGFSDATTDITERNTGDPLLDKKGEFLELTEGYSDYGARSSRNDDERPSLEATLSSPVGLSMYLLRQLSTSEIKPEDYPIAELLIGSLDKNGYLAAPVEEIGEMAGRSAEDVEEVLQLLHLFDPMGVGARNLQECLLIQLEAHGYVNQLPWKLIKLHISALEMQRYDLIAKLEKVTIEEVVKAVKAIQKFEPRPGRQFVDEPPIYITPDVYVRKLGEEYVVVLNDSGIPRLRLNPEYRELLSSQAGKSKAAAPERDYLQDRLRSAAWLIKSIHQRQQTIQKVTESIMQYQREFLEQGIGSLRPLVLRDVAQDVGMHESTVSRVTTNKYVHTPQGIFELKYFFSSGLKSDTGEVSSESVKELIRELVAKENTKHPLSDQAIVAELRAKGIDIARRTVAKYREMLHILSSSRRKKVF